MPHTLFIADLHLSEQRPDITACLLSFLKREAVRADALYVLGDLFEYWVGDDDTSPFNTSIAQAFNDVAQAGVPIYFVHGNRDFLIRQKFAQEAGMTLLPEQSVHDLYGTPTLISHGDELCTQDVVYQKFRKKARGWWWPRLVLALPLSVRKKIAENGREKSKQNQQALTAEIMDVTPSEVIRTLEIFKVQHFIHGHTHRPHVHHIEANGKAAKRIVLGDWYDQGSVLTVTNTGFELSSLDFNQP